ncbi:hypothetical protein RZS08_59220, partial [Arthrospira platensis SPKY1]|nr:hypothetical protein [Arthrospira platensis SPKY1]
GKLSLQGESSSLFLLTKKVPPLLSVEEEQGLFFWPFSSFRYSKKDCLCVLKSPNDLIVGAVSVSNQFLISILIIQVLLRNLKRICLEAFPGETPFLLEEEVS